MVAWKPLAVPIGPQSHASEALGSDQEIIFQYFNVYFYGSNPGHPARGSGLEPNWLVVLGLTAL